MKKVFSVFLAFLFLLNFYSYSQNSNKNHSASIPADSNFWSEYPHEQLADFLISRMTDEELLAQIFMFGWAGEEPSVLLNQWVSERGLGSVKVFGWNTNNTELVAKSVASLQERAQKRPLKIPLFVATDQEGGWIRHVKGDTTETPGNMAIGASRYPVDAYYSAYYISREIKALGINMNFAPTVDLYTNQDSSVISSRSFGEDAEFVSELGSAFAAGSMAAGVIPTAKHFPGHGDTSSDSHIKLPGVYIDWDLAEKRELLPYKYLISQNIPAIMSGHLLYPRIDSEPASLSRGWLTDILREKLGFKGLIITDDMHMAGAWGYAGSTSEAFKRAINAGNDIILSSQTAELDEKLWTLNLSNIKTDPDFRKIVTSAAHRVILAKLEYFKGGNAAPLYPEIATLKDKIPDQEGQKFFLSQACRSITLYKRGNFPFKSGGSESVLLAGQKNFPEFFEEGKKHYGDACKSFSYEYNPGPNTTQWMCDHIGETADSCDTIIICVADEQSARIAKSLEKLKKRVIVLSVLTPIPVLHGFDFADTILFGYSYSPYTFQALFAALCGDFEPKGELPLDLK